jgi:hypothetical protein
VNVWGELVSKHVIQAVKDCEICGVQTAERVARLFGSMLARPVKIAHVDSHAGGICARGASAGSVCLFSTAKADARVQVISETWCGIRRRRHARVNECGGKDGFVEEHHVNK